MSYSHILPPFSCLFFSYSSTDVLVSYLCAEGSIYGLDFLFTICLLGVTKDLMTYLIFVD